MGLCRDCPGDGPEELEPQCRGTWEGPPVLSSLALGVMAGHLSTSWLINTLYPFLQS